MVGTLKQGAIDEEPIILKLLTYGVILIHYISMLKIATILLFFSTEGKVTIFQQLGQSKGVKGLCQS
jgi:hypothetical protein